MTSFQFALLLLFVAVLLFLLSNKEQKRSGLPSGRVIYSDMNTWGRVQKPLFDASLQLVGKPDYLVRKRGQIIPVEVKSGKAPDSPYDSHVYQLASYCYLVHKTMGKRPPYGIIHYKNRNFAIDYTPALEANLLDILKQIRDDELREDVSCSHKSPSRCIGCGFLKICSQSLV